MAAALKQETEASPPEDLSQLHTVELAKILYDESRGSARAMAAYQEILNRQALEDMKRSMDESRWQEAQKRGPKQTRTNAQCMREDWHRRCIELLLGNFLTRKQLISTLVLYSEGRYRGKHGAHIEESTIAKWLTVRIELQIRHEVDALLKQGITAATYER